MECDWVRQGVDNNRDPTYKRDESGFLLANFSCMVEHAYDFFVLPSQVQQVFYADADITLARCAPERAEDIEGLKFPATKNS